MIKIAVNSISVQHLFRSHIFSAAILQFTLLILYRLNQPFVRHRTPIPAHRSSNAIAIKPAHHDVVCVNVSSMYITACSLGEAAQR